MERYLAEKKTGIARQLTTMQRRGGGLLGPCQVAVRTTDWRLEDLPLFPPTSTTLTLPQPLVSGQIGRHREGLVSVHPCVTAAACAA